MRFPIGGHNGDTPRNCLNTTHTQITTKGYHTMDTSGLICGHSWEAIQRAQKGGQLHRTIDTNKPPVLPKATEADLNLLREYGSIEALETAGFYGTADRLKREPTV